MAIVRTFSFFTDSDEFIKNTRSKAITNKFKKANENLYLFLNGIPMIRVRKLNPQKVHIKAITGNARIPA